MNECKKEKKEGGKKFFVSLSGGESSCYMIHWMEQHRKPQDEVLYAIANTSKEREETLRFANESAKYYNIDLVWIEAKFSGINGVGTKYTITYFASAKREGEVFEAMIREYGLPNQKYPHCTRELKTIPLQKLAKDILGDGYITVIGIRRDEIDRVNSKWRELNYYYPLVHQEISKPMINCFWRDMPFRLELKGYEGNCGKCWKKSTRKLMTIECYERISHSRDEWWQDMELKYGDYVPKHRIDDRKELDGKLTFYRNNLSSIDIMELSKHEFELVNDDSIVYEYQKLLGYDLDNHYGYCSDSCEPF
jgi:hypothetical protein